MKSGWLRNVGYLHWFLFLILLQNLCYSEFYLNSSYKNCNYLQWNASMIFFQILETDFQMKFSRTSNNMLPTLFNCTLRFNTAAWVGFAWWKNTYSISSNNNRGWSFLFSHQKGGNYSRRLLKRGDYFKYFSHNHFLP